MPFTSSLSLRASAVWRVWNTASKAETTGKVLRKEKACERHLAARCCDGILTGDVTRYGHKRFQARRFLLATSSSNGGEGAR